MATATIDKTIEEMIREAIKETKPLWQEAHDRNYNVSQIVRDVFRHYSEELRMLKECGVDVDELEQLIQQAIAEEVEKQHAATEELISDDVTAARRRMLGQAVGQGVRHLVNQLDLNKLHSVACGDIVSALKTVVDGITKATAIAQQYKDGMEKARGVAERTHRSEAQHRLRSEIHQRFRATFKDVLDTSNMPRPDMDTEVAVACQV